jgi:L,D-transpeptidase YcbB
LNPQDYEPLELQRAIASDDAKDLERQATESFALIADDLVRGRIRPGRRGRYYIASDAIDPIEIARLLDSAIASRQVGAALEKLAPRNPEYRSLRQALARLDSSASSERRQIKVNLERWRWLPRDLGTRHLLVNIPEYRLHLIEGGRVIASHRVIVGKKSTPTPQFSAEVTAVILNPSWHVPQSIIRESVGNLVRSRPAEARRRGYTWAYDAAGRLQVTQRPGPQNALGQMKLEMTNPLSIYIHDTPNKDLFEREERTFSHGCIRTQDPLGLAATLLTGTEWSRDAIDRVVERTATTRAPLTKSLPAYAIYMTAVPEADGSIRYLDDPYNLDPAIAAQLH